MPTLASNTILQVLWVRSLKEHFIIVVAFDKYRVQAIDNRLETTKNMPQVGQQSETLSTVIILDDKTHTLDGIMRRSQWLDTQRTDLKRLA